MIKWSDWIHNAKPNNAGYYTINYCWDIDEGSFCEVSYWNGNKWNDELPISKYAGPFENKELAESWLEKKRYKFLKGDLKCGLLW